MITHTDAFKNHIDSISDLLLIDGQQPKTTYIVQRSRDYKMSREDLDKWYTLNFNSFPLHTTHKSDEVTMHSSFRHYFLQYHKSEDFNDDIGERIREVDGLDRDSLLLDLDGYIREWIENLFYDFAKLMVYLKAGPVFACITNDIIILKNLVKFYTDVRKSKEIQLNFFHNITVPESVANQMTDVLIQLLSDKINMVSPYTPNDYAPIQTIANNDSFKINWLTSQQEFMELVHELSQKGYWSLPGTNMAAQARHLASMFDFSASQRKPMAHVANNLLSYLKPILDKELKTTTYSYLKPAYDRKFTCIPAVKRKK